jgi:hypothetical protein
LHFFWKIDFYINPIDKNENNQDLLVEESSWSTNDRFLEENNGKSAQKASNTPLSMDSNEENEGKFFFSTFNIHIHSNEIILNDAHISNLPYDTFHKCKNLIKIDLSKNGIDIIEMGLLNGCKQLREINLNFNRVQ